MSEFYDVLLESVQQMDQIVKGEHTPSSEFHIDAIQVNKIRMATGLTQLLFAQRIGIQKLPCIIGSKDDANRLVQPRRF